MTTAEEWPTRSYEEELDRIERRMWEARKMSYPSTNKMMAIIVGSMFVGGLVGIGLSLLILLPPATPRQTIVTVRFEAPLRVQLEPSKP